MTVTTFQDLPLAHRDRSWDAGAAEKRVRRWVGADDEPTKRYREAHVWYDGDAPDEFGSDKPPIADVVDGRLTAVPRGVMAAGNVLQGARGGVDIPRADVDRVRSHLARYYEKMGEEPPWAGD